MNEIHVSDQKTLILMYHRIADPLTDPWSLSVTPQRFAEHLDVIRRRARPTQLRDITPRAANTGGPPMPSVVVTFDDGYTDNLYQAKPLLEQYDVPATLFVMTGQLGSNAEFWWDRLDHLLLQPGSLPSTLAIHVNGKLDTWELGDAANYDPVEFDKHRGWTTGEQPPTARHAVYLSLWQTMQRLPAIQQERILADVAAWAETVPAGRPEYRPMTPSEVAAMASGGLIEIGAHSVTHPVLSSMSAGSQRDEIAGSKARLEEILGHPISSFAYPYGDHAEGTVVLVRESGIARACSTQPGVVTRDADPLRLPRMHVHDWSGDDFEARLSAWCGR